MPSSPLTGLSDVGSYLRRHAAANRTAIRSTSSDSSSARPSRLRCDNLVVLICRLHGEWQIARTGPQAAAREPFLGRLRRIDERFIRGDPKGLRDAQDAGIVVPYWNGAGKEMREQRRMQANLVRQVALPNALQALLEHSAFQRRGYHQHDADDAPDEGRT